MSNVPGKPKSRRRSGCPVSISLEIFGDRWSLLIIRDLMVRGFRTFKEFQGSDEGIATNILSDRLQKLQASGIITAEEEETDGRRVNYRLTEKGIDLAPVLLELLIWGARHEETGAPCALIETMEKNREEVLAEVRRRWRERDCTPLLPKFGGGAVVAIWLQQDGHSLGTKRRRMSGSIEDEIKKANAFRDKVEELVVARGSCPTGDRNTLLMGYWSLVFEFHRGILCLLSHKFYGAAFALVRPIIEATVRAHVVIMGSAEDVRKLREDEYRTNLATIGTEIDRYFGTGDLFGRLLTSAREALHSYTHAGVLQLGRRFSGTDLVANYEEGEILEVIRVSTSVAFMVNNLVTKHFGFEEEWKNNMGLYEGWGRHA